MKDTLCDNNLYMIWKSSKEQTNICYNMNYCSRLGKIIDSPETEMMNISTGCYCE